MDPKLLQAFANQSLDLFEFRIKLYDDVVPPQPVTDTWASSFFVKSKVWAAMSPQQQGRTLQLMIQLLKGVFQATHLGQTGGNARCSKAHRPGL